MRTEVADEYDNMHNPLKEPRFPDFVGKYIDHGHIRPKLPSSVLPSDEIPHLKDGMEVWTAGLVIRGQRPLGKAVFITLEDEFGHTPLIVWPAVYAQYRLILREPVLMIRGTVSRREGTMNIMVTHAESLHTLKDIPRSKNWG